MAKNWSVSEALQVITIGNNLEAIRDIGRRFPLFLFFVLHNPLKIIEAFGERVTARTVNKQLELGILDANETADKQEEKERPVLAERMDHVEKGAKIGKSREVKKEKVKKIKKEEKKHLDVSSEAEMKKMEKGEMPKDRLITDDEVIQLHEKEKEDEKDKVEEIKKEDKKNEIKKEDKKDKIEKEDKVIEEDVKKKVEVQEQEKMEDEEIEEDDLDFSVEDLLEE